MTFLLVSVVFAVAISRPGHGNIGPLAVVGAAAGASAGAGGRMRGGRWVQDKGMAKQAGRSRPIILLASPLPDPSAWPARPPR